MKLFYLIPVILLLVSGCTVFPGRPTIKDSQVTKGIVVKEFKTDFDSYYSGEDIQFDLTIENHGDLPAKNIRARLIVPDKEWSVSKGECNIKKLDGSIGNIPGEEDLCSFNAKTPQVPKNTELKFYPYVRITYDYETFSTSTITLVKRDEARRRMQKERLSIKEIFSSRAESATSSPVSIFIRSESSQRIPFDNFDFPLQFDFVNDGGTGNKKMGGRVCKQECSASNYDKLEYTIHTGNKLRHVPDSECPQSGTLSLFKGEDNTLTCNFAVQNVEGATDEIVTVNAKYRYQIDKSVEVRVIGASRQ